MTTPDALVAAYRMAGRMLHRMTDDLTPADFRHRVAPGANTPAWVVGHLAVTLWRTADRLGAPGLAPLPPGVLDAYTQTGQPAGEQAEPGDPAELLALFDAALAKVVEAIPTIAPEKLDQAATRPGFAATFGEGVLFGALHVAMHGGQLSLVRRSLGKPPVV